MNIVAQNLTEGRTFGMQDVSECGNVNEILDLLQLGDYQQEPLNHVCEGYSLIRDDFGKPLSIVSDTYDLLQPLECFSFMDAIKSNLGFEYKNAGFSHGGRRMMIVAEYGESCVGDPKVGDIVKKRIVARTSFDGTISTNIKLEMYRLWCKNGCGNWIQGDMNIRARHSKNQRNILNDAIDQATGVKNIFMQMHNDMQVMNNARADEVDLTKISDTVFPSETTRAENVKSQIRHEFHNEERGTFGKSAWDVFNAFTSYQNHFKVVRDGKKTNRTENHFHSAYDPRFARKVRRAIQEHLHI
jgi:hypothetical protein